MPPGPPPRRRRRGRPIIVLLVLALIGWLGFTVYTPFHAWGTAASVPQTVAGDRPTASGSTYLLVGSDSRDGLTEAERKALHAGKAEGKRTDSIILVHVPSGGGKSVLISIPRDSYLPIPGHGKNKVNAAYAIGGPTLLIRTLEQATGLPIDGYLEIGLFGFTKVVDSLGGVDICVKADIKDKKTKIDLKKGCQRLDGVTALGYVRARYSDPRGDIGRADRQRQFLGAIMKQAAAPSTVLVPTRWWDFTHAAAAGITIGDDTSLFDAWRIVSTLRGISGGDTLSLVVPLRTLGLQTPNAGVAVQWDDARAKALFTALRDGEDLTTPPAGTDGAPTGG